MERFTLYRTQYDLYTQHCGKLFWESRNRLTCLIRSPRI